MSDEPADDQAWIAVSEAMTELIGTRKEHTADILMGMASAAAMLITYMTAHKLEGVKVVREEFIGALDDSIKNALENMPPPGTEPH